MKIAASILLIFSLAGFALAETQIPEPTFLEEFVSRSDTVIESSSRVGSINSSDAILEVSVLVVKDISDTSNRIRGLRFDLKDNGGLDQVYLDETQLHSILEELIGIERGVPMLEERNSTPYRVQGTESCWMPDPPVRILCPGYRVGPDWSGLILGAFGGRNFEFPNVKPPELTKLIIRATEQLEAS